MPLLRLWLVLLTLSVTCLASVTRTLPGQDARLRLSAREMEVWKSPTHDAQFADVPRTTARSRCEATQPPEALATPNPLLRRVEPKITVSFIIGADGRVHSPLILESAGDSEDRAVLTTIRSWRYRPAMCNGVPTEVEGKVEFSSR